ncbi:MAG: arginase [Proteobacteria bacterium]|nr:arginase [Pseudomonadota bacterium]
MSVVALKRNRRLRIIGAASGIGAQDAGCADGPVAFHRSQAWHQIAHHPQLDWGRTLFVGGGEGATPVSRIAELCRQLAAEVGLALSENAFPLVIGGDHSVAIGTWGGVARLVGEPLGMLWIDAHLDSHTPETSYSGAIHGMPLACLLGRGDKRLLHIGLPGAQLSAAHCVVLGARSYEPEERSFLAERGVRIIDQEEIGRRGFAACRAEALAIVAGAAAGFGVTLDLDALDPQLAPGVGSPEPDGLGATELRALLQRLAGMPGLRALEIAEYNPDRDQLGLTAKLIADLIGAFLPVVASRPENHA